ncbi:MAG: matrixin family metalloprotease [Bacteroidota bacterium]
MFRYSTIIMLGLLSMLYAVSAQQSPKISCSPDCVNMAFPYVFCDGSGQYITRCTTNPSYYWENGIQLTPLRKALPICVVYDPSNLQFGTLTQTQKVDDDPDHDIVHTLFDYRDVPGIVAQAAVTWTDLCPPQSAPPNAYQGGCCVTVFWSTNSRDLDNNISALALTHQTAMSSPKQCFTDCGFDYIALNQTREFLNVASDGYPQNFFYTEEKNMLEPDWHYFSLRSAILHELGHWLGMQHTSGGCGDPGGIMQKQFGDNTDYALTAADICMFQKLYCCESTAGTPSLPEMAEHPALDIHPNPVPGGVYTISFPSPIATASSRLRVIDAAGMTVQELALPHGARSARLDGSRLASGRYVIELIDGRREWSGSLVIRR